MVKLALRSVPVQQAGLRQAGAPPPEPGAGTIVTIGCDLSCSKWVYSCRWDNQEQRKLSSPGAIAHLEKLVAEYRAAGCFVQVVYEACGFGYEIAWRLASEQVQVLVVAPSSIEKAPGLRIKTDAIDARTLAHRAEIGMLKGIYVPTRLNHLNRQLSRTYEQVMRDRKRQQARVRLMLQQHGCVAPGKDQGWGALVAWLDAQELPAPLRLCIDRLRHLRQCADEEVRRLQGELRKVSKLPEYGNLVDALVEQPGVGRLTAIRFVLEVGEIERFARAQSLANYLGLTPSEYSSGDMVHRGRTRRCGPGTVRGWLVQCAWAAIRGGKDPALSECFERLAGRVGRKRAIIAVARRLALRLRARWLKSLASQQEVKQVA